MSMKNGIAKGAVVAGLGIAIAMGTGSVTAYAAAPSIDGTPANPMVTVDQSHAYAPGDEVTIDVSQTVGTEKYDEFVLSDVISTGVLDITDKPAHVYKVSADGTKSEVNGAGTYTYDKDTKTLAFSFSKDYLDNKMESDGSTTYVLEYTLKVTDADGIRKVAGGASGLDLDVSAASTIAVDGHDAYSKGATERTIAIDADAKSSDTKDDTAFDPISYISSLVASLFADHSADYSMVSASGTDASVHQASAYKSHVSLMQVADDVNTGTSNSATTSSDANATNGNTNANDASETGTTNKNQSSTNTTADNTNANTGNASGNASNTNTNTGNTSDNASNTNTNTNTGNTSTGTPAPVIDATPTVAISLKDDKVEPGGKTTGTLTISAAAGKVLGNTDYKLIAPSGVKISGEKATPDASTLPTKVTVTFTATVDNTKDVAGKTLTITGGTKDGTASKSAAITVRQPAVSSTLTADKTKMETGETVTFTSTASAVNDSTGTAPTVSGVVRTMTLTVPDGSSVIASDNGTVKQDGTNVTVTWAAESGNGALAKHTVKVTVPDTADTGGKSVTATGTITGANIADTTLGGNPTVDITPNTAGVTITPDKETVDTGDTLTFKIEASKLTGHLKNAKLSIAFFDEHTSLQHNEHTGMGMGSANRSNVPLSNLQVQDDGTGKKDETNTVLTYDLGDLTASSTKTITITVPDTWRGDQKHQHQEYTDAQSVTTVTASQNFSMNVDLSSDTSKPVSSSYDILEHVTSPTITGTTTISNAKPSAGDTIDIDVTPQVNGGGTKNLVTQVTLAGVDGIPAENITMDDEGAKLKDNVVTFPAVPSASGELRKQTIHIKLPDDGTMNEKTITATATAKASNIDQTHIDIPQSAVIQKPLVTLKTSATAVSNKAAVDGKTTDSNGGTTKATETSDADASAPTTADDTKKTTDGKGSSDTEAATNPQEKKDANLVINNGDEIEYNVVITQDNKDAHANGIVATSKLDDFAAQNGVYIEPDTIVVKRGNDDITKNVSITYIGSENQRTGIEVSIGTIGNEPVTITYKAITGEANNDLMRGKKITNTTSITGTNFLVPNEAKVDVEIASASLSPSIYTNAEQVKIGTDVKYEQVKIGTDVKYTTIITNNKSDSSSIAKNVYAASAIDDYAAKIGVAIDPSSLQLLYIEDGKAKDVTKDATIKWDGTKGFSVDTNVNLAATHATKANINKVGTSTDDTDTRYSGLDHALVILYSASTTDVNKDVYGENDMTDTIITRADNATYAATNKSTRLVAYDVPVQQDEQGGTIADSLTQTGDATVIAGIGTAIAAGIAGIVAVVRRRRH